MLNCVWSHRDFQNNYVTAPIGDRSEGKYIKITMFDVYLDFFVIWNLELIWIVENLRTGSTNISRYRGGHPDNFYFLTCFDIFRLFYKFGVSSREF